MGYLFQPCDCVGTCSRNSRCGRDTGNPTSGSGLECLQPEVTHYLDEEQIHSPALFHGLEYQKEEVAL